MGQVNEILGGTMSFTNNDVVKVDLRWQVGSIGMAANVFQALVVQATPHSISDATVIADMATWMHDFLAPMETHVVVSCEVMECSVYQRVGTAYNLVGTSPVDFTPGSIGDPLPSGVAALMTAYTNTSKVVGKKYLPGLSELAQTAGLWITAVGLAMVQSALIWVTPFSSIGDPPTAYFPGVWSLKLGVLKGFSGAGMVRDVPAYQRRRKQGVGA